MQQHHHPSEKPPGPFSEPDGITNLISASAVPPTEITARAVPYLESAVAYWEMARMYWARSKALGSGQFFWLRLPLS
jgi:hypothetical protein